MRINILVAAIIPLLLSCGERASEIGPPVSWNKYKGRPTTKMDTLIQTQPFVAGYVNLGNLEGLSFVSTENIALAKQGDSLGYRMLEPGEARVAFFDAGGGDTVLKIRVTAGSNARYEQAMRRLDNPNSFVKDDSLAYLMHDLQLLNKPFPAMNIPLTEGGTLQIPNAIGGKMAVLNAWYYGCPPCMEEIPDLNRLKEIYTSDSNLTFISLFKDSAYYKGGQQWFYNESVRFRNGVKSVVKEFKQLDFHFVHAYGFDRFSNMLNMYGYPKTWLVDQQGIIRLITRGGGDGIGPYLDQQITFHKKRIAG